MSVSRIQLWDFEGEMKQYVDELILSGSQSGSIPSLDPFSRGGLQKYTLAKITSHLETFYKLSGEQINEVMKSPSIYTLTSEFFAYEKFKNAFDAKATQIYVYFKLDLIERNITVTIYDNGIGLKKYLNKEKNKSLKDIEGGLSYLKVVSPTFDNTKPESKTNVFTRERLISDKKPNQNLLDDTQTEIEDTNEAQQKFSHKQAGGRALGLRADAILAYATGGDILLIDAEDFRKSKKYQDLTGITDLSCLPETGAFIIHSSKIFSNELFQTFKEKNLKYIKKQGSTENSWAVFIDPQNEPTLYIEKSIKQPKENLKIEFISKQKKISEKKQEVRYMERVLEEKTEALDQLKPETLDTSHKLKIELDILEQSSSQLSVTLHSPSTSAPHNSPSSSDCFLIPLPSTGLPRSVSILTPRSVRLPMSKSMSASMHHRTETATSLKIIETKTPNSTGDGDKAPAGPFLDASLHSVREDSVDYKCESPATNTLPDDKSQIFQRLKNRIHYIEKKLALPTLALFSLSSHKPYSPFKKAEKLNEVRFLKYLLSQLEKQSLEEACADIQKKAPNLYKVYGEKIKLTLSLTTIQIMSP